MQILWDSCLAFLACVGLWTLGRMLLGSWLHREDINGGKERNGNDGREQTGSDHRLCDRGDLSQ